MTEQPTVGIERARGADPARFVVAAERPATGQLVALRLDLADRPLVAPGQRVELGQPLIEHFREVEPVEVPTSAALIGLAPGMVLDTVPAEHGGRLTRKSSGPAYRTRVCEHGRDGVTRLAAGSGAVTLMAPASGLVETISPARLDLRVEGLSVPVRVGWGRPTYGRVMVAVESPEAELRSSRIDVSAAGAILVVGSRIDVEALSRARAIGAAGVIAGGIASRDLRQLASSEVRQQAALHAAAPFGLVALGGYGRVPIPRHLWDLLMAADGRLAGIVPDVRALLIDGDPVPLLEAAARPPQTVRVIGGEQRDREGRLVGLAGPRYWPGGGYAAGGFVELPEPDGRTERHCLPLTLLERLG
ncbi:MAG: hypothetical protein PVG27_00055 [Chloroflexota bacterium]|jgi:hypothetical protein